jgi:hypothetical protein
MRGNFFTSSVRTERRADAEAAVSLLKRRRWCNGAGCESGAGDDRTGSRDVLIGNFI